MAQPEITSKGPQTTQGVRFLVTVRSDSYLLAEDTGHGLRRDELQHPNLRAGRHCTVRRELQVEILVLEQPVDQHDDVQAKLVLSHVVAWRRGHGHGIGYSNRESATRLNS